MPRWARIVTRCLAVLVLVACGSKDVDSGEMTRYVLLHDGLEREYFVFLPSSYDSKSELPALLFMHGYGGTATGTEIEVTQGLNAYAEKFGYVVIYPQGTWFAVGDSPETKFEVTSWNHISDGFDQGPLRRIILHHLSKRIAQRQHPMLGRLIGL